jgi:hypothetical protein
LKPAAISFSVTIVGDGTATMTNRLTENSLRGLDDPLYRSLSQGCRYTTRLNSRAVKEFIRVDITNTSNNTLIHKDIFYWSSRSLRLLPQIATRERTTERFNSECCHLINFCRRANRHQSETPRIVIA